MATIPLRSSNAYLGVGLQAAQGTATAPTVFPRILDGSSLEWDLKAEDVWEMDGSRRLSTIIKNLQQVKIKVTVTPRATELGFYEKMAQGAGADSISAASGGVSTTTTSTVTGGTSTTVAISSATGTGGASATGTIQLLVDTGANAELVTFSLPIATLTLTVAAGYNGGKFAKNHSSGVAIVTPCSVDTSVTTSSIVGASSLAVGNNVNLAAFPQTLVVSPGTANEENVTFSAISGAGPYSLTVAASYNGGTMLNAHTSGDAVISGTPHVLTDQNEGSYYSVEIGLGALYSAGGIVLRGRDCKAETIKRSGKAGSLFMLEMEITGLVVIVQGSPSTPTYENHLPFLFVNGTWTLDGSTTGDALTVSTFDVTQKNNLDLVQTEQLTGAAIIYGRVQADVSIAIVYQATTTYLQKVFAGGASGTTDVQTMFAGSLTVVFANADGVGIVQYKILTLLYTKASTPMPKADGKHLEMSLQASSTSNQGQNAYICQSTVTNTQLALYA